MKAFLAILFFGFLLAISGCEPDTSEKTAPTPESVDPVLQQLKQAIANHPDSVKLYDRLIDYLTQKGSYQEAANLCNELINRSDERNYYYWYVKGDIFRKGKLYDSAIAAYNSYLKKFPDDEEILLHLGYTYGYAGYSDALEIANLLSRRFATREMRSEAAFIKGLYYNTTGKYVEARKFLNITIQLNYNFTEAYMEKGYSYFDQGNYKEALNSFTTLNKLDNNNADALYWMAKSQEALGNKKEAINNYTQAYALDNNIAEAKESIERLKKELGIEQ